MWSKKSRISAFCVFGARAEGFCSFGASGSYVGIPSCVIVAFPCQFGLWHPISRKRETYKLPKQRDRTKRPCEAHRPAVRMAHSLLKGEKLNKSKIASETSTLLGKSSKEKNVMQRKDYRNKRGTCWSRVYVYIRLDDITLPLDLGEYRFCLLGG